MQNWGRVIPQALASGTLASFQDPVDVAMPTISSPDLGQIAADLWLRDPAPSDVEIFHAEGPRRYSASDVATVVSELSGRTIHAQAVPRDQWPPIFARSMAPSMADLMMRANDAKNRGLVDVEPGGAVRKGTTTLIDALRPLVSKQPS